MEYNLKEYQFLNLQVIVAIFSFEYQANSSTHNFGTIQNEAVIDYKKYLHV